LNDTYKKEERRRKGLCDNLCMWIPDDIVHASISTHCVSNLEARAVLESRDDLSIQASGIEGEIQLFWNSQ